MENKEWLKPLISYNLSSFAVFQKTLRIPEWAWFCSLETVGVLGSQLCCQMGQALMSLLSTGTTKHPKDEVFVKRTKGKWWSLNSPVFFFFFLQGLQNACIQYKTINKNNTPSSKNGCFQTNHFFKLEKKHSSKRLEIKSEQKHIKTAKAHTVFYVFFKKKTNSLWLAPSNDAQQGQRSWISGKPPGLRPRHFGEQKEEFGMTLVRYLCLFENGILLYMLVILIWFLIAGLCWYSFLGQ